jgi:hypothetical protein
MIIQKTDCSRLILVSLYSWLAPLLMVGLYFFHARGGREPSGWYLQSKGSMKLYRHRGKHVSIERIFTAGRKFSVHYSSPEHDGTQQERREPLLSCFRHLSYMFESAGYFHSAAVAIANAVKYPSSSHQ